MQLHIRFALVAIAAAAILAAAIGSASAGRLSSSSGDFRVAWTSLEFVGGGVVERCRVTLEGTFAARTIQKVAKTLVGRITRAIIAHRCTNGEMWAYNGTEETGGGVRLTNTLPWHVTWGNFTGTLPRISAVSLLIEGARFMVEVFGVRCPYTAGSTNGAPRGTVTRNTATGVVDNMVASSGRIRPDAGANFLCPELVFSTPAGDGATTVLGSTTRIALTLI